MSSKNGTDPAQSSPALSFPAASADEQAGRALRYFMIVLGLCSAVAAPLTVLGGALYALDARAESKIEKHAKRPHVGVATKDDVAELKTEIRETKREILEAVRK